MQIHLNRKALTGKARNARKLVLQNLPLFFGRTLVSYDFDKCRVVFLTSVHFDV